MPRPGAVKENVANDVPLAPGAPDGMRRPKVVWVPLLASKGRGSDAMNNSNSRATSLRKAKKFHFRFLKVLLTFCSSRSRILGKLVTKTAQNNSGSARSYIIGWVFLWHLERRGSDHLAILWPLGIFDFLAINIWMSNKVPVTVTIFTTLLLLKWESLHFLHSVVPSL